MLRILSFTYYAAASRRTSEHFHTLPAPKGGGVAGVSRISLPSAFDFEVGPIRSHFGVLIGGASQMGAAEVDCVYALGTQRSGRSKRKAK